MLHFSSALVCFNEVNPEQSHSSGLPPKHSVPGDLDFMLLYLTTRGSGCDGEGERAKR